MVQLSPETMLKSVSKQQQRAATRRVESSGQAVSVIPGGRAPAPPLVRFDVVLKRVGFSATNPNMLQLESPLRISQ
jgi:hypothetical protein